MTDQRVAGRRLDAEIAEKVMGWTKWTSPMVPKGRSEADCWRTGNPRSPTIRIRDWSPSTDIADAMGVLATFPHWTLHTIRQGYTGCFCAIYQPSAPFMSDSLEHFADGPTLEVAICLAALTAVSGSAPGE